MGRITLKGTPYHTVGDLPEVGSPAPNFELVRQDLAIATLATYAGMRKVLNVFPSLDTPVCALSIKRFNERAAGRPGTVVLNVSADLPFAAKRFCATEGITGAETLSTLRSSFGQDYGLEIADGPLAGLCSRAVIVLDAKNRVLYREQVPEIAQEPDYATALKALGA